MTLVGTNTITQTGAAPAGWFGRWALGGFLLLFVPVFYLFSYNSGFGYDATEYLAIARLLSQRFDLYALVPSKSWGIYAYTNLALRLLSGSYDHSTVSALITFNAALLVSAVFVVVSKTQTRLAGWLAAVLAGVTCCFTEMNFLEPEILVVFCALAGYYILTRPPLLGWRQLFWGSFCIGCGMWFKVVAAFYFLGLCAFIVYLTVGRRAGARNLLVWLSAAGAGVLLPQVIVALAFFLNGQFAEHVEWTYLFPLRGYPANTYWLDKLLLKLAWFHALLGYCLWQMRQPELRARLLTEPVSLALCLAGFSLPALLKTQASHYFFPAAVFFAVFMAVVLAERLESYLSQITFGKLARLGTLIGLAVAGAAFYRPDAAARLFTLRSYAVEAQERAFIQHYVPAGKNLLALSGGQATYFNADRYPNVPLLHTDVQATRYLALHPEVLERALDDPNLKLVLFDDENLGFDDPQLLENPGAKAAIERFAGKLRQLFKPARDAVFPYKYWLRKTD